jgi:molecular chaperone GrpE
VTDRDAPEPGAQPVDGSASGGERPADRPRPDHEAASAEQAPSGYRDTVVEGEGPAAESADRVPPETGREADPVADPIGPTPIETTEPAPFQPEDPITILTHERDDYRDALVRLQADFENYKKRMIKQQTDHLERAAGALVDKLLPVLDTADLAVAHGAGEDVKQVSAALANVLEREGLERIDPVGERFDPTLHDAVAHEPGDGSDAGVQEVAEVLRAGYRWKGRVLRPAMVKVKG